LTPYLRPEIANQPNAYGHDEERRKMGLLTAPQITITGNVEPRMVTTKTGAMKQVFSQAASFKKDGMQLPIDVEVDGPNLGYAVGQVLEWDVVADLSAGQYGRIELARKKTLRPLDKAK